MDHYLVTAIFVFLSILMFRISNTLLFEVYVTNVFTSQNDILLRCKAEWGKEKASKAEIVSHEGYLTWIHAFDGSTDEAVLVCKCHVTEIGNIIGRTYYGYFEIPTLDLLHHPFIGVVNEEGAFMFTKGGGYQPLYVWLRLQFYVYNMFDEAVRLTAITGVHAVVKSEKVQPKKYLQWTRVINQRILALRFTYKCRLEAKNSPYNSQVMELFNSSTLDVNLLKEHKTLHYIYAMGFFGLADYDPQTSHYTPLSSWPRVAEESGMNYLKGATKN